MACTEGSRVQRTDAAVTLSNVTRSTSSLADVAAELRLRTRTEQGLPPVVTDTAVLRRVADVVRPASVTTLATRARRSVAA